MRERAHGVSAAQTDRPMSVPPCALGRKVQGESVTGRIERGRIKSEGGGDIAPRPSGDGWKRRRRGPPSPLGEGRISTQAPPPHGDARKAEGHLKWQMAGGADPLV